MLDVLIIGSGPAGLSAAIYAKRADLEVLVVEKMTFGTGQIAESDQVDNYLGVAAINGYELGKRFREHAVSLGVTFKEALAKRFEKTAQGWKVFFSNGEEMTTKTVIYAAGAKHRHLEVEGEDIFLGKGVSYCATCDGFFFQQKTVAVIGGGNTAMDDALYLSGICQKVYLIHRRNEFRGSAKTLDKIRQKDNIELITGANVAKIIGETAVSGIVLDDNRLIEVEGVFIAVGMIPQTEEMEGVVNLDQNGYVVADETGRTSAEGLFVAGDVRTKKLRQIVTAVSDGANAVAAVVEYFNQGGAVSD